MPSFSSYYFYDNILKIRLFLLEKIKAQSPTAKNVITVAGGTAVSQLIVIAATPLLSRIYGPESFGILAVFISILSIANVISSLRYELAITLPKEDNIAISLIWLIACFLGLSALISLIGLIIFWELIPLDGAAREVIYLLPLAIIPVGLFNALSFWLIRKKEFKLLSSIRVKQSLLGVIFNILLFFAGPIGLAAGTVVGRSAGIFIILTRFNYLFPFVSNKKSKNIAKKDSQIASDTGKNSLRLSSLIGKLHKTLVRYRQFPFYSLPSGIIITTANEVPTLLIASFYGLKVVGAIFVIRKILVVPTSLVSNSINQVLRSDAPRLFREGKLSFSLTKVFKKLLISSSAIIIPFSISLYFLLPIVLGVEWSNDSLFAIALVPLVIGIATVSPLSVGFGAAEKLREGLIAQIIRLLFQLVPLYLSSAVFGLGPMLCVAIFSFCSLLGYISYFAYMQYILRKALPTKLDPSSF